MIVRQVMKKPLVVSRDMTLQEASQLMTKHNISSLIVVMEDKIIGIVTHQDLVQHFAENKKISEVMSKKIITAHPKDSIQEARDLIVQHHISILPVVDEKGLLIGVIHAKDILATGLEGEDFLLD